MAGLPFTVEYNDSRRYSFHSMLHMLASLWILLHQQVFTSNLLFDENRGKEGEPRQNEFDNRLLRGERVRTRAQTPEGKAFLL